MTVIGILGPTGSYKTSIPLSMPGKKFFLDLELGVDRAAWRFPDTSQYEIWKRPVDTNAEAILANFTARRGVLLQNKKEQYLTVVNKFVEKCMDSDFNIIVIDTAKELWDINCAGYLQELQEDIEKSNSTRAENNQLQQRVQLTQMEYRVPNDRMKQFFATARSFNKHLVVINHSRPVREERFINNKVESVIIQGKFELDGFNATEKLCDWVLETHEDPQDIKNKWLTVKKSPIGPSILDIPLSMEIGGGKGFDYSTLETLVKKLDREIFTL